MKENVSTKAEPQMIFECPDYIVIDKPAGLTVHPDGKSEQETLTAWLMQNYPELVGVGEPLEISRGGETVRIDRPGIVHRLDKETSGIMVVARTQAAFAMLKEQFMEREVGKTYRAFVYGWPPKDEFEVDLPISRSASSVRRWSAGHGGRGEARPARTLFRVISRGSDMAGVEGTKARSQSAADRHKVSYIEAIPKTGRTHQIRVHAKAVNHPVVMDSLYAPGRAPLLGFGRLALHAHSLEFADMKGEMQRFEAPLPPDFIAAEQALRSPESPLVGAE